MPRCQNIKISSRARPSAGVPPLQSSCLRALKRTILPPRYQDGPLTRLPNIYNTKPLLPWCQRCQNVHIFDARIDDFRTMPPRWQECPPILVPRCQDGSQAGAKTAAKLPSWCQGAAKLVPRQQLSCQAGAKMSKYQDFFRARGHVLYYPSIRHPGGTP